MAEPRLAMVTYAFLLVLGENSKVAYPVSRTFILDRFIQEGKLRKFNYTLRQRHAEGDWWAALPKVSRRSRVGLNYCQPSHGTV
jgi:hypothetical protein